MLKSILHKLRLYTFDEVQKIEKTKKDTYNRLIDSWQARAIRAEEELKNLKKLSGEAERDWSKEE